MEFNRFFLQTRALNPKNVVSLKNIQKLCVAMTKLSLTFLSHFQVANDYKCQNFQLHERSEMLYNNFIHLKRIIDTAFPRLVRAKREEAFRFLKSSERKSHWHTHQPIFLFFTSKSDTNILSELSEFGHFIFLAPRGK